MGNIKLGAFSISLAVKDLHKSREFYESWDLLNYEETSTKSG